MAIRAILVGFVLLAALAPVASASEPLVDTITGVLGALPVASTTLQTAQDAAHPVLDTVVVVKQTLVGADPAPMREDSPAAIDAGWGYDGNDHADARGEPSHRGSSQGSSNGPLSPYRGLMLPVPLSGVVGAVPRVDGDLLALPLLGPAGPAAAAPASSGTLAPASAEAAAQGAAVALPLVASPVLVAATAAASAAAPSLLSTLADRLRRAGFLTLYTRISKERLLDHAGREKLLAQLHATPGISVVDLAAAASTPRNTATYHLRRLEKEGLAVSVPRGRVRLWFAAGSGVGRDQAPAIAALRHDTTRAVAQGIGASPGIDQRTLCAQLSLPPSLAHWHADRLVDAGLVRKERDGRHVRYYPGENFGVVARTA